MDAEEINDLFDDSPLENVMWDAMKKVGISTERQFYTKAGEDNYILDFAIRCANGKIDVETDSDKYHTTPDRAAGDNLRNNALTEYGWQVLPFSTVQICEKMESYCILKITDTIDNLGGLDQGNKLSAKLICYLMIYLSSQVYLTEYG